MLKLKKKTIIILLVIAVIIFSGIYIFFTEFYIGKDNYPLLINDFNCKEVLFVEESMGEAPAVHKANIFEKTKVINEFRKLKISNDTLINSEEKSTVPIRHVELVTDKYVVKIGVFKSDTYKNKVEFNLGQKVICVRATFNNANDDTNHIEENGICLYVDNSIFKSEKINKFFE